MLYHSSVGGSAPDRGTAVEPLPLLSAPLAVLLCTAAAAGRDAPSRPLPDAPFTVEREAQLLLPPLRPPSFRTLRGQMTGPVNAPGPSLEYFRDPAFRVEGASGRLYYALFMGKDVRGEDYKFGYIRWTPAGATKDRAQRFLPLPGHSLEEFTTDGRFLEAHHYPAWPRKGRIVIQRFRWKGDPRGNGRWVSVGRRQGEPVDW